MKDLINTYLNEMSQTKSATTVKNHRSTLNKFFEFVEVEEPVEVMAKDVMKFKNMLLENGTVASVNTQIKRIKLFFKWCVEKGLIDDSPADEIGLVSEGEQPPKWLTPEQEDLLIRAIRKDYLGTHLKEEKKSYREYAIVLLMLKAGLRVSEVCNLKWADVELGERKGSALIRGKNNQQRVVPIISDVLKVMKLYLQKHGKKGEYVFYSQKSDRISERMVQTILNKYKGLSNGRVTITDLTPHILRHTFAHNLANAGMALEAIARLLGHMNKDGTPNIKMTIRYTKASNDEIFDQVEKILAIG
jgi:site-specific recombinase XerD